VYSSVGKSLKAGEPCPQEDSHFLEKQIWGTFFLWFNIGYINQQSWIPSIPWLLTMQSVSAPIEHLLSEILQGSSHADLSGPAVAQMWTQTVSLLSHSLSETGC
jgi:hypothetical protein